MNRSPDGLRLLDAASDSVVRGWASNFWSRGGLKRVEVLKEPNIKSAVFRLHGSGAVESIVAKWGRTEAIELERLMHGHLLPHLGLAHLHIYYQVADQVSGGAWLFMEDAGDQPFDFANATHVGLASDWLAKLHTRSARLNEVPEVPIRGSIYILQTLRQTLRVLDGEVTRSAARRARAPAILALLVETLATLEAHWDTWATAPDDIPDSLSHNDFSAKNVRIRRRGTAQTLIALDWEHTGWGVPLADLERIDPQAYLDSAHAAGSLLTARLVQRGQLVGRIYRLVEAISWACAYLCTPHPEKALERYLPIYQQRLSTAIAAVERQDR